MKKILKIDLDYEVDELREHPKGGEVPDNSKITRNIIENVYAENHKAMAATKAREWRRVVKAIDRAIEAKESVVVLRGADFDSLKKEVYACEFPPNQAFIVPVLLDELDRVEALPKKEMERAILNLEENRKSTEQVDKVMEMSQAKSS